MMLRLLLKTGSKKVLIDTWWNVNWHSGAEQSSQATVLIDTWWNVNDLNSWEHDDG